MCTHTGCIECVRRSIFSCYPPVITLITSMTSLSLWNSWQADHAMIAAGRLARLRLRTYAASEPAPKPEKRTLKFLELNYVTVFFWLFCLSPCIVCMCVCMAWFIVVWWLIITNWCRNLCIMRTCMYVLYSQKFKVKIQFL